MVSIWDAYVSLRQALTDIGVEEAELEARELVAFALHGQAKHARAWRELPLDAETREQLHALFERRKQDEPLAYILGEWDFYGNRFVVTPDVLIPRGDTEWLCDAAVQAAKRHGVTVSCDLNYRKNLWSREEAGRVMGQLVPMVDVLIANEEDAADVFGICAEATDITAGKLNVEGYRSVARQLVERFGCKKIAVTLRESLSASDNNWSGMLYDGVSGEMVVSKKYAIRLVDRLGGGDSFGSGLIYALLSGYGSQEAVEFAAAASALKQTIEGDVNRVTVDEVRSLMGGNASGRVQR